MTTRSSLSAVAAASLASLVAFGAPLGAGALSSGCKARSGDPAPAASEVAPVPPAAAQGSPAASASAMAAWQPSATAGPPVELKMAPVSFAPIAKRADASVVAVHTTAEEEGGRGGGLFGRRARPRQSQGLGSGFIADKDGLVITNNHVIEGANEIVVQLSDERRFPAKVVGRDPQTDIAIVRLEGAKDLVPIPLGDSDGLEVGDWVVAIGNPFGLAHTVSAGIVSGKGRSRDDVPLDPTGFYNFVQTDASINPGNSGGPLLNLKGEVVGMNTAVRGGGAQGIGFAIPINMVRQLMPTLLEKGHITRSALGIRIRDARELTPADRTQLKLDPSLKGAVVEMVDPGGPADKAKLEVGDVIVAFEGQPIDRGSLLQWLASTSGVGKGVTVRVVRAGKPLDLKVTLGELKVPKAKPASLRPIAPRFGDDDDER